MTSSKQIKLSSIKLVHDPGNVSICSENKLLVFRSAKQIFTNGSAVLEDNENEVVLSGRFGTLS